VHSKSKYAILVLSSVLVVYAIIGGMLGRVSAQNGSYQQLSIFMEVLNRIQSDYVDEPSLKDAVNGAIRGLVENVDPYGGLLSPKDVAFYKDFNQKTPGIGVVLARRAGYPVIVSAIPGGPAAKAGLGTADFIESIDGLTTREMNLIQVYELLASPAGKPVTLSVIRRSKAEPEPMTLNRETVQAPAVEARMIENNIAYVHIPLLAPGKALEAKRLLDGLLKKGATSVLLDLRATAGGEEKEAVELANLFVDTGTIGILQGQKLEKKVFSANPKDAITKSPLVVLVNQGTSGAAEMVAGAIGDSKRGQLVGQKTFGAGSFQRLIPLEDGSGLLISVGKYYTPNGTEIQEAGIKPTVEVGQPDEDVFDPNSEDQQEVQPAEKSKSEQQEDRQMKKAIEMLKAPAAKTA